MNDYESIYTSINLQCAIDLAITSQAQLYSMRRLVMKFPFFNIANFTSSVTTSQ
jgi:hypothetical protein